MKVKRLHVFDICLILLLLLSVIGIGMRWNSIHPSEESWGSAEVTLRVVGISPLVADCIASGEALYCADGERWGNILSVERRETPFVAVANGEEVAGAYRMEDRVDLELLAEVRGERQSERFLRLGREALLIGRTAELYTKRAYLKATLLHIEAISPKN